MGNVGTGGRALFVAYYIFSNPYFSLLFSPLLPGSHGVCFSANQQSHGSDQRRRNFSDVPSPHHKARRPVPGSDPAVASHKNKSCVCDKYLLVCVSFINCLLEILFILLVSKINVFYTKFTAVLAKKIDFFFILHIICMLKSFIEIF